jgi:vacuolar-type H+-ATPase subunit E/Vma4
MTDPTSVEGAAAEDALPRTDFDLEAELEELAEFVRSGASFMNHGIWLDLNEYESRMERILTHLPKEIRRARRITQQEQRILEDAKEEAGRLLGEARTEADELVAAARREAERILDASSIKQAAIAQAEEIIQRAQASAQEIRERAFAYGRDVLASLQATVASTEEQIRIGQQQLAPPG